MDNTSAAVVGRLGSSVTATPRWPTTDDLAMAEEPYYVLLSRVLHGLRHLPRARERSYEPAAPAVPTAA